MKTTANIPSERFFEQLRDIYSMEVQLCASMPHLARINHKLRSETPRETDWDKAGEGSREGCMGTYCPNRDSSPTQSQPASRKSQQLACDLMLMWAKWQPMNSRAFFPEGWDACANLRFSAVCWRMKKGMASALMVLEADLFEAASSRMSNSTNCLATTGMASVHERD